MRTNRFRNRVFRSRSLRSRGLVFAGCICLSLVAPSTWAQDAVVQVEAGKVGIGVDPTILPAPVLLNVRGSAASDALVKVQNTAGSGFSGLEFHNAAGTPGFFFGVNNSNNTTRLNSFNDFPFLLMTNSQERIRITPQGNIGIRRSTPLHPLHVGTDASNGNGAHVTAAGVWTNGSSRQNKVGIRELEVAEAMSALTRLEPVRYVGKDTTDDEEYLGFIAEDVPALVAMNDRKGLSSMDIVAVLTKVAQEQQRVVAELAARVAELETVQAVSQADLQRCQSGSPDKVSGP